MSSSQLDIRKKIVYTYNQNIGISQGKLAKLLKVPKSTVQKVLHNYQYRLSVSRKDGSGRKHGPVDKTKAKNVIEYFKKNPTLSVRDVARKCKVSKSYVQKIKQNAGLRSYKASTVPNRDATKDKVCKTRARKLYTKYLTKFRCILMDDETYVKADFKQLPGLQFYVANQRGNADKKFTTKKLDKFAKKFLVWQAICSCGQKSKSFVGKKVTERDVQRLMEGVRSKVRAFYQS